MTSSENQPTVFDSTGHALVDTQQFIEELLQPAPDAELIDSSTQFRNLVNQLIDLYEAALIQERSQLVRATQLLEHTSACLQLLNGAVLTGGILPSRYYKLPVDYLSGKADREIVVEIEGLIDTSPGAATPDAAMRRFKLIAADLEILTQKIISLKAAQKPCTNHQQSLELVQKTTKVAEQHLLNHSKI